MEAKVAELVARQEASNTAIAEVQASIQDAERNLEDNEMESDNLAEMLRVDQEALEAMKEQAVKQDHDIGQQRTMLEDLQKRRLEISDKNTKQAEIIEKLRKDVKMKKEDLTQSGRGSPADGAAVSSDDPLAVAAGKAAVKAMAAAVTTGPAKKNPILRHL